MPDKTATTTIIPTGKVRPAEKRNIGINAAKGDLVAFIDDDAYPDAHWLEYAVKYFGDESIGAVGGPGVTPPGDGFLARAGGRVYYSLLVSGNYRYRYKAGGDYLLNLAVIIFTLNKIFYFHCYILTNY